MDGRTQSNRCVRGVRKEKRKKVRNGRFRFRFGDPRFGEVTEKKTHNNTFDVNGEFNACYQVVFSSTDNLIDHQNQKSG